MRLVLDVNVLISGLLSRTGAPARLLELWLDGELELVVCDELLEELQQALASPKLRRRIPDNDAAGFVTLLRDLAELVPNPTDPPSITSQDPAKDYLIAVASREHARLVSGDADLLALTDKIPVFSPRAALDLIG